MKSHFYEDFDQRRAVPEQRDRLALEQTAAGLRPFFRKKGDAPEGASRCRCSQSGPGDLDAVRLVISRADDLDPGLVDRNHVVD